MAPACYWKCQTSSCACFSYCCLKVNNYHVRKPQQRLIFIPLPCHTPVPPPSLSSPAQPPVPLPPQSPHVVQFVLCKSAARNSANITPLGDRVLVLCFAGFYFASAQSSTRADTKGSPSLSQAAPAATALPRQQPVLLLGSVSRVSFTAPAFFTLKNEENPSPQCEFWCFLIV